MKTKKTLSFYIILILIFTLLYVIFAMHPLSTEYQLEPGWKIDVSNPSISIPNENEELFHFKLGQSMGYFTEDGNVTNFVSYPYKSSISQNLYTYYNANNSSTPIYSPDGKKVCLLNVIGFPMIQNDRIYVFLPGGSSFAQCTLEGKKSWEYTGTVPITAFDSSESGCAVGFADGNICEFNNSGTILQRFSPGGSNHPVILGVAISKDASLIAAICGQDKQRFILAKNDGSNTKIIFHKFLDSKEPFQKLVQFYNNDNTVLFNSGNIIGIVDTNSGKYSKIEIQGQALNAQESENCVFVLTKHHESYTVYMIEKFATLIGKFTFKANTAFIQTYNNKVYIGKDSTISQLTLSKK